MKNFFKENYIKIIVVIIIVGGIFYWFQIRPSQIRKECMQNAQEGKIKNEDKPTVDGILAQRGSQEKIEELYSNCLRLNGLAK